MNKPIVAIVGRPNVGKSTFFNKVAGRRLSIVKDRPGVTRDRLYADCEWNGCWFTLVDTGGLEIRSTDVMFSHIREQVLLAVDAAEVILFFTDFRAGMTSEDEEVAAMLRRQKKPVLTVVNKVDHPDDSAVAEYYALGLGEVFPVSSESGAGVAEVLDHLVGLFSARVAEDENADALKIAVVGRPTAGKSSLCNFILGYDRSIVTDIAGTTRDAIDTPFERDGKRYVLIDTAGMRRQRSVDDSVEEISVLRAQLAIRRADVCLIVIDASEDVTEQDVRVAGFVHEAGKPSVVVMNKWDLVPKDTNTIYRYQKKLEESLKFMDYFKAVYVSAKTGQRVDQLIGMCEYVYGRASTRIRTGLLNDVIHDAVAAAEPPFRKGKKLKIFYCTQVEVCPPLFALFVNDPALMHFSYKRYLENCIRKAFELDGTPIRFTLKQKNDEGGEFAP